MEKATFEHDKKDPLYSLKEKTPTRFGIFINEIMPSVLARPSKMTKATIAPLLVQFGIVPPQLKTGMVEALQDALIEYYGKEFETIVNNSDESWNKRESKPLRALRPPSSRSSSRASSRASSDWGDDEYESLSSRGFKLDSIKGSI